MILDIQYYEGKPEQIQNVRMTTVYTYQESTALPEFVIQFKDYSAQRNIRLFNIRCLTITND